MTQTIDRRVTAARRIASHIAEQLQADLSLELWTGEVIPLGPKARDDIRIVLSDPSAVRRLVLKPGLMTLFELYATGDIRIEGGVRSLRAPALGQQAGQARVTRVGQGVVAAFA